LSPSSVSDINKQLELKLMVSAIQTFAEGNLLHINCMDVFIELCADRDEQLNSAHKYCNEKKRGYTLRMKSQFIKREVTEILFAEDLQANNPHIVLLAESLRNNYLTYIPYFSSYLHEWVLITIDYFNSTVNFIYTRYEEGVVPPSTAEDRANLNLKMKANIQTLLLVSQPPLPTLPVLLNPDVNIATFRFVTNDSLNLTPQEMAGTVSRSTDSGIYIIFAIECLYFDAPLFAEIQDWHTLRRSLAFNVVKGMLMYL